jgi:hypothetical protein
MFGIACIDLFHDTDFETLCTHSPNDPACGGEAGVMVEASIDAPVEATRPRPDFCAWSSVEAHTQALRACAWLGACEGPLGESAFGPCVMRARLAFDCTANPSLRPRGKVDAFWACLAAVQSCGDVDRCVFPDGVQDCVAVPVGSSSACGTVGDNTAVRLQCAGPAGRAAGIEPCAMLGKTCSAEDTSTSACTGTAGFQCVTNQCSGTSAVDCSAAGLDRGMDCAGYGGGSCVSDDAGLSCTGGSASTACADAGGLACDGTTVTTCAGGKEIRVECDRLGLPCDLSQPVGSYDPTAACINRAAGACEEPDTCLGKRLQSCGRGVLEEIDCTAVGLGACKLGTAGRAMCTKP